MPNIKYKPAILVALAALLWSLDGVFRTPVSSKLDSSVIVFFEFFFSTLILFPYAFIVHKKELFTIKLPHFGILFILGLSGGAVAGVFFQKV